ncbi:hypothetical protein [Psychromonas aquimarina]|uniref:hypothetical protein n=1 Tax=Psychromonas aquimarina TaxID=444919 RepID=UPI000405B37E|nr:hypothetical protein [Psychromonas aquimarina]
MPSIRRLQHLFDQIRNEGLANRSDVLRLFSLVRELAESKGKLKSYPSLRFFADWTLHPKLDRASARELISEIVTIYGKHKDGNPSDISKDISNLLSIDTLHQEIQELLIGSGLPVFLIEQPEPWQQCVSWLLQDLIDKPIIGSEFTEEEERTGWGITPRAFRLEADPRPGSQIMWRVDLGPRVRLTGRLVRSIQT